MKISEKIKKIRKEKGWSQTQLANKLGILPQNLSRYERGTYTPSTESMAKLAEVFGVSVDYLISEDPGDSTSHKIKDKQLQKYLEEVDNLNEKDKELVKGLIEAVLVKDKVKDLVEKKF